MYNKHILLLMMTHSQLLEGLKKWVQVHDNGRGRSWGTFLSSQHFEGYRGVLELRDGIKKNWQASLTHIGLHTTYIKWLVHSWSTLGARKSHGQHGHTRLTMARTWGKPLPSPLEYTLHLSTGPSSKWLFSPMTLEWESRNRDSEDFCNFEAP
jgi:hypothetical protein